MEGTIMKVSSLGPIERDKDKPWEDLDWVARIRAIKWKTPVRKSPETPKEKW